MMRDKKDKWTVSNTQRQNNIEMLSPDVKEYNSTKITVTVVYRPPDAITDCISNFELHLIMMKT